MHESLDEGQEAMLEGARRDRMGQLGEVLDDFDGTRYGEQLAQRTDDVIGQLAGNEQTVAKAQLAIASAKELQTFPEEVEPAIKRADHFDKLLRNFDTASRKDLKKEGTRLV